MAQREIWFETIDLKSMLCLNIKILDYNILSKIVYFQYEIIYE